jgi:3-hydroxyisobutyrate dehydrogenase
MSEGLDVEARAPGAGESVSATVGLIGVGAMGLEVGSRLAQGGMLGGAFDTDDRRIGQASERGIPTVSGINAFANASFVICLLPNSDVVDRVVAGPGGLLDTLEPGAMVMDMGSSDPRRTRVLAEAAKAKDISFVDSPVSGGVRRARTGELTAMVGGRDADVARCRPVLDLIASRVIHIGDVGAGHAMKALNNFVSAAGLTVACEAIEVGRRFGLEPEVMLEALNVSTGSNNATQTKLGQFVLSGTYDSGFSLRLMLKDVSTAVDLADEYGVSGGLAAACRQVWREAADELPADADQTEIARTWSGPDRAAPDDGEKPGASTRP